MNLTQPFGRADEAATLTGDRFFLGVDERLGAQQLAEGYGAYGQNLRFRDQGRASTRKGSQLCPWMRGTGRTPWTEVYGGVVFSDPNQAGDWFIIAADGGVWKTRPNMTAQAVSLPVGVTLTAETFKQFVANTDGGTGVLVLLRGPDADPLVCVNLDAGFSAVPAHTGGTRDMPRSSFGINTLNRLLLIEGKDIVAASDILAYNDFVAVQNEYRINPGNSQALVALLPMPNRTLLCFKTQSVLQVTDVANTDDGSLAGQGPEPVAESYGVAGPRAIVRKGSNCYWVTNEPSVTSLRLTELNETQDTDVRLSDALSQTFGRINSLYLDLISVEVWDGKLYVMLPLEDANTDRYTIVTSGGRWEDGPYFVPSGLVAETRYYFDAGNATSLTYDLPDGDEGELTESGWFTPATSQVRVYGPFLADWTGGIGKGWPASCNAIAVFDFVTGAWCGVDEAPGVFAVKAFLKTPYLGKVRLFLLGADGTLRLYEEGFEDDVIDADGDFAVQDIPTLFRTRGYALADGDKSRALSAVLRCATWAPSFTLATLTQGYNTSESEGAATTRSRVRYDNLDQEDYDESNEADDHETPGRQDYSVVLAGDGMLLGSGANLDAHQISTNRVGLSRTGDWQQIEVRNTAGRLELLSVVLEQVTADREGGITAL